MNTCNYWARIPPSAPTLAVDQTPHNPRKDRQLLDASLPHPAPPLLSQPKVLSPGLVFPVASGAKGGVQAKDDGTENEVESWSSEEDEAGAEQTQPEEDWRRNERDDLVGGKLQEVNRC